MPEKIKGMSRFTRITSAFAVALAFCATPAAAVEPAPSLTKDGGELVLRLPLARPALWRIVPSSDAARLVVEVSDPSCCVLPKPNPDTLRAAGVSVSRAGWSEMTLDFARPVEVASAEMRTGDGAPLLEIRLYPDGTPKAAAAPGGEAAPDPKRLVIAIDPGHGGRDPGAQYGGITEAELTLEFAGVLRDALLLNPHIRVVLTRDADVFVPLEDRLTRARAAGADVFISLHADALSSGRASGITVYSLPSRAEEAAAERMAERHSGTDLLTGLDLTGAGDDVKVALLDLARRDTEPRNRALSAALVGGFRNAGLRVNSRPERQADLAVLRAAEIPSVLIELGFISSKRDRGRLTSDDWQAGAAAAIRDGLLLWQDEDRLRRSAVGQ